MGDPGTASPEPPGVAHSPEQTYRDALLGSLHRQHQAAGQLAAQEAAQQATVIEHQRQIIEAQQDEIARLEGLLAGNPEGG